MAAAPLSTNRTVDAEAVKRAEFRPLRKCIDEPWIAIRVLCRYLVDGSEIASEREGDGVQQWIFLNEEARLPECILGTLGCTDLFVASPTAYDTGPGLQKLAFSNGFSVETFLGARAAPDTSLLRLWGHRNRVHHGVPCSGCGTPEIVGERFVCQAFDGCLDVTYCATCHKRWFTGDKTFARGTHLNHTMTLMETPTPPIRSMLSPCLSQLVLNVFESGRHFNCLAVRDPDRADRIWQHTSYSTFHYRMSSLAAGLSLIGPPRSFVGIMAVNSIEWLLCDMACTLRSYVFVPIHTSFDREQTSYIAKLTDLSVLICGEPQLPLVLSILPGCPLLKRVVVIGSHTAEQFELAVAARVSLSRFADHEAAGEGLYMTTRPLDTRESDLVSIVFTSGTSGSRPKGSAFTSERMCEVWQRRAVPSAGVHSDAVRLEFQPFAWTTARYDIRSTFMQRGEAAIFTRDPAHLFEEIKEVRPTKLKAVPAVFQQLYSEYERRQAQKGVTTTFDENGVPRFDPTAIAEFRATHPFGDRVSLVSIGGAKITETVKTFIHLLYHQAIIIDAYGTTEVGGITTNGRIKAGLDYKLVDVPEMGYLSRDLRGELWVRTEDVGYYKDEEATNEKFKDGYFCTGDIVEIHDGDRLRIIDRKQHLFKLQDGEFISPDQIERVLQSCPLIKHVVVFGSAEHNCIVAVAVVAPFQADDDTKRNNAVMSSFRQLASAAGLRPKLVPAAVLLTPTPFSISEGTLTPTSKISRVAVQRKYAKELEALFAVSGSQRRIQSLIEQITSGTITPHEDVALSSLGLSSIDKVQLAQKLVDAFPGVSNQAALSAVLEDLTISDLLSRITEIQGGRVASEEDLLARDLERRSQMDTIPRDAAMSQPLPPPEVRTYLITGATGFLGIYLLISLLRRYPRARFLCLVRARDSNAARQRLTTALAAAQCSLPDNVVAVCGDLESPGLGLSSEDKELISSAHVIYHCGATVNWLLPYSALRNANAFATLELLMLAIWRGMVFHHISTIGAARGVDKEEPLSDSPVPSYSFAVGYNTSKWLAEQYVNHAVAKCGLHATISRPGMVVGHSTSGHCHVTDFVPRLLRAILETGFFPATEGVMEMLPVDCVARIIVACAENSEGHDSTTGRESILRTPDVYHVCNTRENLLSYDDMGKTLRTLNPDLRGVSAEAFIAEVEKHPNGALSPLLDFIRRPGFFTQARVKDSSRAQAAAGAAMETGAVAGAAADESGMFVRCNERMVICMAEYALKLA